MIKQGVITLAYCILTTAFASSAATGRAQDYVYATGNPNFGVQYPVPDGYINVTNGNVHLTIPLGQFKQRGTLPSVAINLEYDSRFWKIVDNNGSYSWQPTNVPNAYAGWRLVTGLEATNAPSFEQIVTGTGTCGQGQEAFTTQETFTDFVWTDGGGTKHTFYTQLIQSFPPPAGEYGCSPDQPPLQPATSGGYAIDGSGYYVSMTYIPDGDTVQSTVYDSHGNEVYPIYQDTYGNTASFSGGTITDSTGRTLLTTATSGSTVTYNVLTEGGGTVPYTITTTPMAVNTSFNQSAVTEYSGNLPTPTGNELPGTITNITLPDGSSYSFTYDWSLGGGSPYYGELQSMTLPTAGVVTFSYNNYEDSYNNENRWISSETDGGGTTQFAPAVLTRCSSNGTGCQEKMTLTRPSGDYRVYTLTLNDGAWDGQTDTYAGSTDIMTVVNNYDFNSYQCPVMVVPICNGAMFIAASKSTVTLNDVNPALTAETDYTYTSAQTGPMNVSTIKYFDYGVSDTGTPSRETDYLYTPGPDASYLVQQETERYWDANANPAQDVEYSNTYYTYDGGGQALTETKGYGETYSAETQFAYDTNGTKTSETDPDGYMTSYSYNCNDLYLSQTTYPVVNGVNHIEKTSPDCSSGLPVTTTDENQQITYYYYDSLGRKSNITYPDGGETTYTYPSSTETTETRLVAQGVSNATITTLDAFGRKSTVQTSDPESQNGYDTVTTTYSTNNDNRVWCVTNPERSVSSSTDGKTCFAWDALDRPVAIGQPDGNGIQVSYQGNQATVTDENNNVKTYTYDAFHDLTAVTEPNGWTTTYAYNAGGNLRVATQNGDGSGARIRMFTYDDLGRLAQEQIPEATTARSYTYDSNGNLKTVTTGRGTITYNYDALNRVTSETGGSLNDTYTYDLAANNGFSSQYPIGRLVEASNGVNASEYFSYDTMGRIVYQANCLPTNCSLTANSISAQYDYVGDVTQLTYPDSRVITQGFDSATHLTGVQYSSWNGQSRNYSYLSSLSYAPPGELAGATYGSGIAESASFNSRNTISALSYSQNGSPLWSKQYLWANNAKNLQQVTDEINSVQSTYYSYDSDNRLAAFSGGATLESPAKPSTGWVSISGYEQSGNPCPQYNCPEQYDDGSISVSVNGAYAGGYGWGEFDDVYSISAGLAQAINGNSNSLVTATDDGGSLTLTSKATGTAANYSSVQASVDDADESGLFPSPSFSTSTSGTMNGGTNAVYGGTYAETYTLDPWGNAKESGNYSFQPTSFGVNNQINSSGYVYDTSTGDLTADPNGNTYTYNTDGSMASASGAQYTYDATDQRVEKTQGGNSSEFVYFAGHPVAVLNPTTGVWTDLIWAGGNLIAETGPDQQSLSYRLLDHLGSPAVTTDASGDVTGTAVYAPYGPLLASSVSDPYLYTGLYQDTEYGGYHAWHRNESAEQIRWLTPDPYNGSYDLMDPQSLNRYAYLNGNPLDSTDPTGLAGGVTGWGSVCSLLGATLKVPVPESASSPQGAQDVTQDKTIFNYCNPGAYAATLAVYALYASISGAGLSAADAAKFTGKVVPWLDFAITVTCSIDNFSASTCGPSGWTALVRKQDQWAAKAGNDLIALIGAYSCSIGGISNPVCIGYAIYSYYNALFAWFYDLFGPPHFKGSLLPRPSDLGGLGTSPMGIPNQNLSLKQLLGQPLNTKVPSPGSSRQ